MKGLDKTKGNWIVKFSLLLITLISLILILYFIPTEYEEQILHQYDNNTNLTDIHISTANSLLMASITFLYVLLTIALVKQSNEAIAQSKQEQYIRDIENKLEKFYIPADDIINNQQYNISHKDTINGWSPTNYVGLKHLRKYSYLADKTTYEAYEKYITSICESLKSTTCNDMYRDFKDYKCPKDSPCMRNWEECEDNLHRCEHFDKCPTKDQDNIIINNRECEYYKELKDAITADIQRYKDRLSELKE